MTTKEKEYFISKNAFWKRFGQLKFDIEYYQEYINACKDRLAILKWVVNGGTILFLCAFMILYNIPWARLATGILGTVLSGLSLLSLCFPFEKRKENLQLLNVQLDKLFLDAEDFWTRIKKEKPTSNKIDNYVSSMKKKWQELCDQFLQNERLRVNKKFQSRAKDKSDAYLNNIKD